jgi:hypothetical protein
MSRIHIPIGRSVLCLLISMFAIQTFAAVVPIGANGDWSTDLFLRNKSAETVTQKLGHLTYTRPGFDPVVIESSVTLKAGETRRFQKVEQFYDSGLWVLQVDSRLEASAFLSYRGNVARFELNALEKSITTAGENATFYRLAIDPSSNINTFPMVLNVSTASVQVELILYGPDGATKIADVFATAAPGINLYTLPALAPSGATLKVCHTVCGVGVPSTPATIYPAAIVGPDNGGTQSPRYAQ